MSASHGEPKPHLIAVPPSLEHAGGHLHDPPLDAGLSRFKTKPSIRQICPVIARRKGDERVAHDPTYLSKGVSHFRGKRVRNGLTLEQARDVLWVYSSRGLYELLVLRPGWPVERYGRFVALEVPRHLAVTLPAGPDQIGQGLGIPGVGLGAEIA